MPRASVTTPILATESSLDMAAGRYPRTREHNVALLLAEHHDELTRPGALPAYSDKQVTKDNGPALKTEVAWV